MRKRFTHEYDQFLRDNYLLYTIPELRKKLHLDVPTYTIQKRLSNLGLKLPSDILIARRNEGLHKILEAKKKKNPAILSPTRPYTL